MSDLPFTLVECPCGFCFTHLQRVAIAERPVEDGPINEINGPVPCGPTVGEGRRDRVALIFDCEDCFERFALVFTQHKGQTLVEAVTLKEARAWE